MKYLFGALLGIALAYGLLWGHRKIVSPYYTLVVPKFVIDTSKSKKSIEELVAIKTQYLAIEEKIASINKRVDDILIFGGIIITLILAINIGVFVNGRRQVDEYLKEHFESYKEKIIKIHAESEAVSGKIKTELDLVQKARKNTEPIQMPS